MIIRKHGGVKVDKKKKAQTPQQIKLQRLEAKNRMEEKNGGIK